MGYRKFKADQIFTGHQFAPGGTILVAHEDGRIAGLVAEQDAGEGIEMINGILSPGFINAHCHLELSHMAGRINPGTGMVNFLLAVMQQRLTNDEEIISAIAKTEQEMQRNGIVAVGDICNTTDSLSRKLENNLRYVNFIECSGFVPAGAASRFEAAQQLYKQLSKTGNSNIVPHAPYSVSPDLFQLISNFAGGKISTMHNQESEAENDFFLNGESEFQRLFKSIHVDISFYNPPGKTSLQAVLPWLGNGNKFILVHNTVTRQEDLDAVKKIEGQEFYYCLCPNANLYINNSLPPLKLLVENQCNIVLGTDSLASNHKLSILEEIKTLLKAFPGTTIETALMWATANGAEALDIADEYGSFAKGKKPGILQIDQWQCKRIL